MKDNWDQLDNWSIDKSNKDEDGNIDIPDKIFKKFTDKIAITINNIKQVGIPKKGEQLRLITMQSFNSVSFIKHIADNEIIEELILIIFSLNMSASKVIIDLIKEGRIKNIKIIVSSIRNAGHKIRSKAVQKLINKGLRIVFVNSHAKITAIKTKHNHYVIEGSGNMSFNGRIEQYVIDNDKELFEFTNNWVNDIENIMNNKDDLQIYNN